MITDRLVCALEPDELERLAAVLADWAAPDYVCIRAIVASGTGAGAPLARLTAMGREFVVDVRRRVRSDGVRAVLAAAPDPHERILENATRQLAACTGRKRLTMQLVARETGIPRRSLYNFYAADGLAAACRRRAQTVWRAHFEHSVLAAAGDAKGRLFAVVDAIDTWVGSQRFRADQQLCARPSLSDRLPDDDFREHLAEIERFAAALAAAARLAAPSAFGAFVATSVASAPAWVDRRAAARAACIGFVERELARRR